MQEWDPGWDMPQAKKRVAIAETATHWILLGAGQGLHVAIPWQRATQRDQVPGTSDKMKELGRLCSL